MKLFVCACLSALVATAACGGDDGGGSETGESETGESAGSNSGGEQTSAGGEGDAEWEQAYAEKAVGISCDQSADEMAAAGAPSLSFDDATVYVGFEQIGDNQNPIVARFDGGAMSFCERHETEGPDGRALGITWDGGPYAYVVYTIVGGGSSLEGKGGWISSYAPGSINGGGPKVSVLGRVDTSSGALASATFVIAVKSDNKVNSHSPRAAPTVLADGGVEFLGSSAHKPIDSDVTAMDCTDYPFDSRYVFSEDLGSLVCAQCTNCQAKTPCE